MNKLGLWMMMLLAALPAWGHTRMLSSGGNPLYRTDIDGIKFRYQGNFRPGITNSNGRLMITANSDPEAALKAAAETWSNAGSLAHFSPVVQDSVVYDSRDGKNSMVLEDTPEFRSVVGGALAITLTFGFPGGAITDTDIIFSPSVPDGFGGQVPFSTTGAANTYDLQAVATHELGHALGAGHSHIMGAVMYPFSGGTLGRTLSDDDVAFLRTAYPDANASQLGGLVGAVTLPGNLPALGIAVTAVDTATGATLGAITSTFNGTFQIQRMPPGNYTIFAEQLANSFVSAGNFSLQSSQISSDFEPAVLSSGGIPVPQAVPSGGVATANFALAPRVGEIGIAFLARGLLNSTRDFASTGGPLILTPGESLDLILAGPGLDNSITASNLQLLGAGISVRPNSVHIDPLINFAGGVRTLRFSVDVGRPTSRSLISVVLSKGQSVATLSGALVIPASTAQSFPISSSGIINAASAVAGPLAPDSWVSVFADKLATKLVIGPEVLATSLDGTTVTVIDSAGTARVAQLQFVSPGQVNFLMPTATAPGTAQVRVNSALGEGSANVQIQRVAAGIFSANSSGLGPAAATYLTVPSSGAQQTGLTFRTDRSPRENLPVDLGASGDQVYLIFYGTGLRGHINPVTATVGSLSVPVLAALAQGQYAGLDQINIGPLPRSLAGRGDVAVVFQVDGTNTNAVTVNIK
ncbi:MAG: matrixin family metalloprotease [Acidobacteriota bacterium]